MRAVLLSDVHADGLDCPRQAALLSFLDAVRPSHLVVAGDLFACGLADADGVPAPLAPVMEALARVPVLWLTPGNHDFLLSRWAAGRTGVLCAPVLDATLCGHRVVVSHGDSADDTAGYRLLSAVLRSGGVRVALDACVRAAGRDRVWRWLGGGASSPRPSAPASPGARLVRAQRARASSDLAAGASLVVHGHTHAPCLEAVGGGVWLNLGDWVLHRTYGTVDADGVALCAWDGTERVLARRSLSRGA
ncbi:MAG: hypothetical protein RLZZ299_1998 [Pseudomonadota bacterium]|jgi:UDP-2,3-diacylglucosamine hydrolase